MKHKRKLKIARNSMTKIEKELKTSPFLSQAWLKRKNARLLRESKRLKRW